MGKEALAFIPVNEPCLDGKEKKYLAECIDTGWISSDGPFVQRLEEGVAARLGRRYGIAVCNGSAALDVAVAALGIGEGDEVILPTFTIISCATAIVRAGAVPVVIDADALTWNMRVDLVEQQITARTKAIMVVHIYGLPTDMAPIFWLAAKYNLKIIEDAAEAIGQMYNGLPCGGFGDISTISFYPNKHITTGEGGMVLTNDAKLADRARSLRNLCFGKGNRFQHENLGWNYRMCNLQAAVGVAQLERLGKTIVKKRQIGDWYDELLAGVDCIERAPARVGYADNIWWVYGLVLKESHRLHVKEVTQRLRDKGIGTRSFFWPMHEQPVFCKMGLFNGVKCPAAERIARQGFYLPSGIKLTQDQVGYVADRLKEILA